MIETVRWLDMTDPDPIFYDRNTPLNGTVADGVYQTGADTDVWTGIRLIHN